MACPTTLPCYTSLMCERSLISLRITSLILFVLCAFYAPLIANAEVLFSQTDSSQVFTTFLTSSDPGAYWRLSIPNDMGPVRIDSIEFRAQGALGNAQIYDMAGMRMVCWLDAAKTTRCSNTTWGFSGAQRFVATPPNTGPKTYRFDYRSPDAYYPAVPHASTTLPAVFDHAYIDVFRVAGSGVILYGTSTQMYYIVHGERLSSSTPVCTTNCYSNVMFLPGIESSRLYMPRESGSEDQLWEPNADSDVEDLYLKPNGLSIREDIYTKEGDVLDELPTGANIYQSFLDDLERWKSEDQLINDYRVVSYDWRLSLDDILDYGNKLPDGRVYYSGLHRATNTPYILQELRALATSAKNGKVMIVTHSNGGLVAKALLKRLADTNDPLLEKIESLVLVAVPQTGTPMAIGAALHGFDQALPGAWAPFILNEATARAFASTSPMAYHLLPSAAYFSGPGGTMETPPITFTPGSLTQHFVDTYGESIDSSSELHDFLLGAEGREQPAFGTTWHPLVLSPSLLSYAESTHAELDVWRPPASMKVYEIAGWGNETLASIRYYTGITCVRLAIRGNGLCEEYAPQLQYSPEKVVEGDGTVIASSALAISPTFSNVFRAWVDLDEYNRVLTIPLPEQLRTGHADVLEVESLRSYVLDEVLKDDLVALPEYISLSVPDRGATESRLHFTLHSPLSLSAHDNQGHEISASVSTIPGAIYRRYGEVQYISIPASIHPTLALDGEADGSFTLDIEESLGGVTVATTTFAGIPSTAESRVSMEFPDGTVGGSAPLMIDYDGDTEVDLSLQPRIGEIVLTPRPLSVIANSATTTIGSDIPALTATLNGFVGDDTVQNSVTGEASCTTTATSASPVGTYPITCTIGTLASDDYVFTEFALGTLAITYRWDGFLQPIDDTTVNTSLTPSVFKGGSTVPVKFQLKNSSGVAMQSIAAPMWVTPVEISPLSAAVDEPVYTISGTSGSTFKWDSTSQQYIYNWSTKGFVTGKWYRVYAQLEDGTLRSVVVGLR